MRKNIDSVPQAQYISVLTECVTMGMAFTVQNSVRFVIQNKLLVIHLVKKALHRCLLSVN